MVFGKLALQCAQLSITESYLFDHFPDNNLIRFSPLSDAKFGKIPCVIFYLCIIDDTNTSELFR